MGMLPKHMKKFKDAGPPTDIGTMNMASVVAVAVINHSVYKYANCIIVGVFEQNGVICCFLIYLCITACDLGCFLTSLLTALIISILNLVVL